MYREANMVVMLHGLNTPVFLQLIPGQASVDYRVGLVPRKGPNAKSIRSHCQKKSVKCLEIFSSRASLGSHSVKIEGMKILKVGCLMTGFT